MAGSKDKVTAYHYTDEEGKEAIEKSGQIEPSKNGAFGPGVYLTTMSPEAGRMAVSQNNWDGSWESQESSGKADHAIQVKITADKLQRPDAGDRRILVHDGPVKLSDHEWKAMSKK